MKTLTVLFLAAAGTFLTSCASDSSDGSYADPDPLRTQGNIQQMHSEMVRQNY